MVSLVLEFVSCCRTDGMRISTAEVLDCLSQLERVVGKNKPGRDDFNFYTVLKANFAKSRREQNDFDRLYHLFFHDGNSLFQGGREQNNPEDIQKPEPADKDMMSELIKELTLQELDPGQTASDLLKPDQEIGAENSLDQALLDFLKGDPLAFIQMVRNIHNQEVSAHVAIKSNLGQLSGRLEIMLGINKMKKKVVQFLGRHDNHIPEDGDRLKAEVNQQMDRALEFLNTEPRPDNAGLRETGSRELRYKGVGEIPFSNLTRDEREQVKDVIKDLVRKLEEITSLRFARSRKGMVDVKKTIHKSTKYLGIPLEIVRRDKPLRKGKIVTLCDVSGSVWSTARFMLNILYSLQSCFARVKSHVFVDTPFDVTNFFLKQDANKAIEKILNHPGINYNAKTDYGLAFQEYRNRHINELDKKTTLIIIGDGRSNYLNPRETVLEEMRLRCRRLIWLNPEQEREWGTGDSEMPRYRNHCNEARACGNLNQLIDFIESLVL